LTSFLDFSAFSSSSQIFHSSATFFLLPSSSSLLVSFPSFLLFSASFLLLSFLLSPFFPLSFVFATPVFPTLVSTAFYILLDTLSFSPFLFSSHFSGLWQASHSIPKITLYF